MATGQGTATQLSGKTGAPPPEHPVPSPDLVFKCLPRQVLLASCPSVVLLKAQDSQVTWEPGGTAWADRATQAIGGPARPESHQPWAQTAKEATGPVLHTKGVRDGNPSRGRLARGSHAVPTAAGTVWPGQGNWVGGSWTPGAPKQPV